MLIVKQDTQNIDFFITEFERKYHFSIPQEYKRFLIKYNGGKTPKTEFSSKRIVTDIVGFYGLGKASDNFSYSVFEKIQVMQDYVQNDMLPIAYNLLGDELVIDLSEENYGQIYQVIHDKPETKKKLAQDFIDFISKCKSQKIGPIRTIEEREATAIANGYAHKVEKLRPIWQAEIDKYSNMEQEEVIL